MAKQGNFTAYQQLTPIKEDFSDNLKQAEDQAFKYRQEQRDIDAANEKKQKEFEDQWGLTAEDSYIGQSGVSRRCCI